MDSSRRTIFQFFKYTVYVLLTINIYLFFAEEFAASNHQFPDGVAPNDLIEAFAATIDTAAWVVLLLMFELETYVLDDAHFTSKITWSLHALRLICYGFILYAFYGYIANLTFLLGASPLVNVSSLCSLVADQWVYATSLDQYAEITAANCESFSSANTYYHFEDMLAVIDAYGLQAIRKLAWVDVINAAVWLLVVMILEIDVRLQERNRFEGLALRISSAFKVILYSLLLIAAIYWAVAGDFVDFWDAFLWLVAFVFIELNVFEWRQEELESAP